MPSYVAARVDVEKAVHEASVLSAVKNEPRAGEVVTTVSVPPRNDVRSVGGSQIGSLLDTPTTPEPLSSHRA